MNLIRAAIIGCGKVGALHAAAYKAIEGVELVAAYDSDLSRCESFGRRFDVLPFDTVERMVSDAKVDVASICTPHPLHKVAIQALGAGAHVLV